MKTIILNKKDGSNVKAEFKVLDLTHIDKIMELQYNIFNGLENKDFYSCSDKEDFKKIIKENGKIIGCISLNNDELISVGVYAEYGYESHNYGHDIEIQGEELLKVGQLESMLVSKDYRGNRLQKLMCEILEKIGKDQGINYICATVEPDNIYSVNTFKNLGYEIMVEKLKYGGLRRYILMKKI